MFKRGEPQSEGLTGGFIFLGWSNYSMFCTGSTQKMSFKLRVLIDIFHLRKDLESWDTQMILWEAFLMSVLILTLTLI